MDVVYICRDGENEELRYSIRSVLKNLKHDNIWVVGGKPEWYTGNHIAIEQNNTKMTNARNNMKAIIANTEISEDFILMNDDFYILKPVENLEYYHAGNLANKIRYLENKYTSSPYINILKKSLNYLKSKNINNVLDYAIHVPFKMNKNKLVNCLYSNMSWRILYGNLYSVGGIETIVEEGNTKDVKVYIKNDKLVNNTAKNSLTDTFLSTDDFSFPLVLPQLKLLFPDKSEFEL